MYKCSEIILVKLFVISRWREIEKRCHCEPALFAGEAIQFLLINNTSWIASSKRLRPPRNDRTKVNSRQQRVSILPILFSDLL